MASILYKGKNCIEYYWEPPPSPEYEPLIWTPAALSPLIWLDAMVTDSIIIDGGGVIQWVDISGGGNHFDQLDSARRPTYVSTGLNSLPTVRFAADFLDNRLTTNIANYTIAFLAQLNVAPLSEIIRYPIGFGTSGGTSNGIGWGGSFVDINNKIFAVNPLVLSTYTVVTSIPAIVVFTKDGSSGSFFINGSIDSTGLCSSSIINMRLGQRSDSTWYFNGDISETVVLPVSGNEDREKIEGYMAHKFNLASLLPSAHPFKTDPPV